MAQIKITFEKEINSSLQAKDIAYFSKTKSALTISEPSRLGIVVLVRRDLNYIVVDVDLNDLYNLIKNKVKLIKITFKELET